MCCKLNFAKTDYDVTQQQGATAVRSRASPRHQLTLLSPPPHYDVTVGSAQGGGSDVTTEAELEAAGGDFGRQRLIVTSQQVLV